MEGVLETMAGVQAKQEIVGGHDADPVDLESARAWVEKDAGRLGILLRKGPEAP